MKIAYFILLIFKHCDYFFKSPVNCLGLVDCSSSPKPGAHILYIKYEFPRRLSAAIKEALLCWLLPLVTDFYRIFIPQKLTFRQFHMILRRGKVRAGCFLCESSRICAGQVPVHVHAESSHLPRHGCWSSYVRSLTVEQRWGLLLLIPSLLNGSPGI